MNLARYALKLYAPKAYAFEKATRNPRQAQERVLLEYLRRNRDTAYGKRYLFGQVRSIADYQRLVPLCDAGTIRSYIDRMAQGEQNILTKDRPVFFGATSGTTSAPKLIPTTRFSEKRNAELIDIWSYYIARDHPDVLRGKIFTIISPEVEGVTPSGIAYGAESGRAYRHLPFSVKHMYVLPYEVFEIRDYNARYYTMLRIGMAANVTDIATLNPNSLVLLCHKIEKWQDLIITDIEHGTLHNSFDIPADIRSTIERTLKPDRQRAHDLRLMLREAGKLLPRHFWPNLEVIECWKGGTVNVYLKELPHYFGDVAIRDLGCHSTEARSSIPMSDEGAGGTLAVLTNFYEFIPVDEIGNRDKKTLLADELEKGKDYFIIVTTPGGLYRYNIDDIVRVDGFYHKTPIIEFRQKGLNATSLAGEKLYEAQVNAALNRVIDEQKHPVEFFCALAEARDIPRYVFLMEFAHEPSLERKKAFLAAMDDALRLENREYDYVRNAQLLEKPVLKVLEPGAFETYKARRLAQGAHEGQFKAPELTADRDFEKNFEIRETVLLDTQGNTA